MNAHRSPVAAGLERPGAVPPEGVDRAALTVQRGRALRAVVAWALATAAVVATLSLGMPQAHAAETGESMKAHQLSLSAEASTEVALDTLTVVMRAQREGTDAAIVQAQLKQLLDAALTTARRERSDALEVSTGVFNLSPRYGREGRINGWIGVAELVLKGRDTGRIAALAGKLDGLMVQSTQYSLSSAARDQHQGALTAQAIRQFRQRAGEMSEQFGYRGYTLVEAQVTRLESEEGGRPPIMLMKAAAAPMADAVPLPTEGGKGRLGVTVQGTIRMTP
ncbi:SIMPL domain-containing protein [Leptothrix discophora]|uniref:SIMPL domain-containing protein n=1 Tax=Leptothrix discophora TaxID=89 RepID=A0ABT9FZ85_LEPDI|nr:SIMPL domain-containing protein [Leptothrix discophora]MDP4299544.1 SIMPL domain-containing protein [Leptothrix discophora]